MFIELTEPVDCVDAIIARVGRNLRVVTPLALGKPNHLLNAIYRRAKSDPSIELSIYTALTLERPKGKSELERRFLQPFVERVFGNYPDLDYELDRMAQTLPENIHVFEFYLAPAKYLGNTQAQRDYISSNYTHIVRDVLERDVNVMLQQVAEGEVDGIPKLSLSANPDLTIEIMAGMRHRESQGLPIALVAQTNGELPFMYGDAVIDADMFHYVVRNPALNYQLFGIPKMSLSDADHVTGLYCSALVKDGGELQVGIGSLGDALVHGLLLRHEKNEDYGHVLADLDIEGKFPSAYRQLCETGMLQQGLFAGSELIVDGFLELYKRGVIKRRVYDDLTLQRLLNLGTINEQVTSVTLQALIDSGAVQSTLTRDDVEYLVYYGVFQKQVSWNDGKLLTPEGQSLSCDLSIKSNFLKACSHCLGNQLINGAVMHGAFLLGNQSFYHGLRNLPDEERKLIRMRRVARINELYGHEQIDRLHRRNARFVNTCMMVTLSGAAVSDGLESGQVLSGVGGQYNFVDMAHALPDGHSVINFRATRTSKGKLCSNIVWNYGHITIPRHLRDVYVNEYGIAYVRGKTDEEIIKELLNITDSRFQKKLLKRAKTEGKIDPTYQIPTSYQNNTPEAIEKLLLPYKQAGLFPAFPFDCEFTEDELKIGKALRSIKTQTESKATLLRLLAMTVVRGNPTAQMQPLLARMGLDSPKSLKQWFYHRMLCAEFSRSMK